MEDLKDKHLKKDKYFCGVATIGAIPFLKILSEANLLFDPIHQFIVSLCMPQETFSYQKLFAFTKAILQKIGCIEEHAATSAKVLLSADLRGIDSHGVARLSGYVRLWEVKRVNTNPALKIIYETPSTAVVD